MPLRTLGRYTLVRRLAAGGMGEVYLAEVQGAANFTKQVAIKRILPHLAANDSFVKKFIDEANVMVHLHHGNIVPVLELADQDGELFIVMEYLPGRDLKAVMHRLRSQKRVFPPDLALWTVAEICGGLEYAHRKVGPDGNPLHIVHRDVSPSNVVLGAGGEVKLVDFGIARARGGLHQSVSGTLQGKFVYMSPEQADGMPVDARSDVFSAGLVLYEMLCGIRPLEGDSETETLRRVRQANVQPPSRVLPDLPAELDAIVMKALARDPAARYGGAGEMRRDILHHLGAAKSAADAQTLGRFLEELFPEGVVPRAGDEVPLSVDDALNLQLGALTPSFDPLGRTRTVTGDEGRKATPARATPAPAAIEPSVPSLSVPAAAVAPAARRSWPAALAGALLVGGAAAAWAFWPRETTLVPEVMPANAAGLQVTVNGRPIDGSATVEIGERYTVCAKASLYDEVCLAPLRIRKGMAPPVLRLQPRKVTIVFDATPGNAEVSVDGLPAKPAGTSVALPLVPPVKVIYTAPGYEPVVRIYDLSLEPGQTVYQETLKPDVRARAPDAGAVAEVAPTSRDAGVTGERPRPGVETPAKPKTVELDSSPPKAAVYAGGKLLGTTPVTVPVGRDEVTYRFELTGYQDKVYTVGPRHVTRATTVRLETQAMGRLRVRAEPPNSTFYLDGARLGPSPLQGLDVPAGKHVLEARFVDEKTGKQFTKRQNIEVVAGQELQLDPIEVGANP